MMNLSRPLVGRSGERLKVSDFVDEGISEAALSASLEEHSSNVVSARGTEDGLVLRIDGRTVWENIIEELTVFLGNQRKFLEGGKVALEWLDRLPTKEQSAELEEMLKSEYSIELINRKRKPRVVENSATPSTPNSKSGSAPEPISLFDQVGSDLDNAGGMRARAQYGSRPATKKGISSEISMSVFGEEGAVGGLESEHLKRMTDLLGDESLFYEEDPNARLYYGTLRSGQKIETPFSLIIVGDVNPGADLIAGGDILVFGSLRGTAHASAYDDEAHDRVNIALDMRPMQLRIGSVISRGSDESSEGTEIARIEDRRIIVDQFRPRSAGKKRFRM